MKRKQKSFVGPLSALYRGDLSVYLPCIRFSDVDEMMDLPVTTGEGIFILMIICYHQGMFDPGETL